MKYNGDVTVLGTITLNDSGLMEQIEFSKINVMSKPVYNISDLNTVATGIKTEGLMCFVINELALYYYNGTNWELLNINMKQLEGFKSIDLSTAVDNSILRYNKTTNQFELLLLDINVLPDVNIDKTMTNPFFIYWDNATNTFKNSELLQIESLDDNTKTYSTTFVNKLIKRIELLEDLILTIKFFIGDFVDKDNNILTSPANLLSTINTISFDIELERNGNPYYDSTYIIIDDSQITVDSTTGIYPTYNVTNTMPITGPITFNVEFTDILDWKTNGTITITINKEAIKFVSPTGTELQNIGRDIMFEINPIKSEFNIIENASTSKIIDPLNGGQIILDYEINDGIYDNGGTNLVEIVPTDPTTLFNLNGSIDLNLKIDTININTINKQIETTLTRDNLSKLANLTESFNIDINADLFKRIGVSGLCHEIFSDAMSLTGFQVDDILYSVDEFNFTNNEEINHTQPNLIVNFTGQYDIFSNLSYINKDMSKIKVKWNRDNTIVSGINIPNIIKVNNTQFNQEIQFTNSLYRGESYDLIIEDGLYTFNGISKKNTPGDNSRTFNIYDFVYYFDVSKTDLMDGFALDKNNAYITINTDIVPLDANNVIINNADIIIKKTTGGSLITLSNFTPSISGGNIVISFDIDNTQLEYDTNYTVEILANSIQYEHTIGSSTHTKIYSNGNASFTINTEAASAEPVEFGFIHYENTRVSSNVSFTSNGSTIGTQDKVFSEINNAVATEFGYHYDGGIVKNSNGASIYVIYTKYIDASNDDETNIVPPHILENIQLLDKPFINTEAMIMAIGEENNISEFVFGKPGNDTSSVHYDLVLLRFANRVTIDKVNEWIANNETWLHQADATSTLPSST